MVVGVGDFGVFWRLFATLANFGYFPQLLVTLATFGDFWRLLVTFGDFCDFWRLLATLVSLYGVLAAHKQENKQSSKQAYPSKYNA